jgi:hypothetical protein
MDTRDDAAGAVVQGSIPKPVSSPARSKVCSLTLREEPALDALVGSPGTKADGGESRMT